MARVRDEAPLGLDALLEAIEHRIEGVGQLAQLVVRPAEGDALTEVLVRGAPRRARDRSDGREEAPSGQPSQAGREERGADEREHVLRREPAEDRRGLARSERRLQVVAHQHVADDEHRRRAGGEHDREDRDEPGAKRDPGGAHHGIR